MLIPFFHPYFSNSLHCFSLITLGYFLFLFHIIPNWNGPTSLCSEREMSSWNYTYPCHLFRKSFTRNGLTGHIFPSVTSCWTSLISGQNGITLLNNFSFLMVSDIPPETVRYILPHGNRIRMVHIHLYQVLFSLCRPFSYMIHEKELILWFFGITLNLS